MLQITKGPWRLPIDMDPYLMGAAVACNVQGAVLCRRKALLRFGGFYENGCKYGEDLYLWLQLMLNYKIFRDPTALFWHHTEASQLARNGRAIASTWVLMPFLTEADSIRKHCPPQYRMLLEYFLAHQALYNAHESATQGDLSTAYWLVERYPLMNFWRSEYIKLRYKLMFPATVPVLRYIRRSLLQSNQRLISRK
jgi:hypothetical protein